MCLKLGRCGREKGPRTESEKGRDHLVCIDDEETGGFARKTEGNHCKSHFERRGFLFH